MVSNSLSSPPTNCDSWETLSLIVELRKTKLVLMEMRWKVVELVDRLVVGVLCGVKVTAVLVLIVSNRCVKARGSWQVRVQV